MKYPRVQDLVDGQTAHVANPGIEQWTTLADLAVRWADPKHPFAAHTSLRPYMQAMPKDEIGRAVDRGFWLGEVLDEIHRDAAAHLTRSQLAEYERHVERRLGYATNPEPTVSYARWCDQLSAAAGKTGRRIAFGEGTYEAWRDGVSAEDHAKTLPHWSQPRPKRNPAPSEDADAAVDKYKEFHRLDPKKLEEITLAIPRRVRALGPAKHVLYRSDKVDPATLKKPRHPVDYIHEHDAGVTVYGCDGTTSTDVPRHIYEATALTVLGKCLGFALRDGTEAEATTPLPDLCCTPDGKCLLVVQDRREVLFMFWGGALGVFARGIDG